MPDPFTFDPSRIQTAPTAPDRFLAWLDLPDGRRIEVETEAAHRPLITLELRWFRDRFDEAVAGLTARQKMEWIVAVRSRQGVAP